MSVLTNPAQYDNVIKELAELGNTSVGTRQFLASEAFASTAKYDTMISKWFAEEVAIAEQD